jgi:hypothetical protein
VIDITKHAIITVNVAEVARLPMEETEELWRVPLEDAQQLIDSSTSALHNANAPFAGIWATHAEL